MAYYASGVWPGGFFYSVLRTAVLAADKQKLLELKLN
jgi:hypothetical protein